ncbi:MAG: hypothetical protein M1825_004250 [Sarcosagium campestre]|nr:MAG: hypothetical protein M1825_004250 [Sarcosagium campestre]
MSKRQKSSLLNGIKDSKKSSKKPSRSAETLLSDSTALLSTSQPIEALTLATRALAILQPQSSPSLAALPALNLLAEINIELGEVDTARQYFLKAVELDPEGAISESAGGGAEKFLWLAELCEEGGAESVRWYERGVGALKKQIATLQGLGADETDLLLDEKTRKLANALCGVIEVYMTDLSWEPDAESRCEALIAEAILVAPQAPEPLQTLASIRISQLKLDDARATLTQSIELWEDLPPQHPQVPPFATRVSLARLLLEVEMYDEAMTVLERLVDDDDQSVEVWYLGGWSQYLMGKAQESKPSQVEKDDAKELLRGSRQWLQQCLRLYDLLEYEDERLREHSVELLDLLKADVQDDDIEEEGEELEGEWEDDDDDDDEEEENEESDDTSDDSELVSDHSVRDEHMSGS